LRRERVESCLSRVPTDWTRNVTPASTRDPDTFLEFAPLSIAAVLTGPYFSLSSQHHLILYIPLHLVLSLPPFNTRQVCLTTSQRRRISRIETCRSIRRYLLPPNQTKPSHRHLDFPLTRLDSTANLQIIQALIVLSAHSLGLSRCYISLGPAQSQEICPRPPSSGFFLDLSRL
jgi:hypothetical protein